MGRGRVSCFPWRADRRLSAAGDNFEDGSSQEAYLHWMDLDRGRANCVLLLVVEEE